MRLDGLVARRLNQTSTFGGLLDMVTDRCSTLGLLFVLAIDYKEKQLKLVSGKPLNEKFQVRRNKIAQPS
jgi:phosphatidylglycerophosphate synthase